MSECINKLKVKALLSKDNPDGIDDLIKKELQDFCTKFLGRPAVYPIQEKQFRPYPHPGSVHMAVPALPKETCTQYNKRMKMYNNTQPKIHCLNALYPVPTKVLSVGYDGTYNPSYIHGVMIDGRTWQRNNWGVLVDINMTNVVETEEYAIYEFVSQTNAPAALNAFRYSYL